MSISATTSPEATRLTAAATDLGPTIASMRDEIERERRLPPALVEQLRDLGFFSLWLAEDFGGPALILSDYIRVIEALSRQDGTVGWCASIGAAYSMFAGLLTQPVARSIFVDQRAFVAGIGAARGTAVQAPGGYRVTGRWAYGSGITHSDWVIGGGIVLEGDTPLRKPSGAVDFRIFFFPPPLVEIIDTWQVGGLRGTGSHDFAVTDLFVPSSHVVSGDMDEPQVAGPPYALPKNVALGITIAAVPLGIARAALDELKSLSAVRTPRMGTVLLRNKPVFQAAVGRAEALLRGARAFLFEVCDDAWDAALAGVPVPLHQRALVRLA